MSDLETALDKLDGWIDEMESAESALDSFKTDADGVNGNINSVLYEYGGCDLDDVANIDIDATELRNAFIGVKEHLPIIQNLNDKIESLEHEVSALQEQLS